MSEIIANFSAGPSALPTPVREAMAQELALADDGSPSIAEVSHRGRRFEVIAEELIARLGQMMGVEGTHEILLLQGGASQQFAQIPMNFGADGPGAYLISGHWGEKAYLEAARVGQAVIVGSTETLGYDRVPSLPSTDSKWAYLHYTGNETIHGVQYQGPPQVGERIRLVSDLSSEFLSRPYPFHQLDAFYAGAQKNLGVAGLTIMVISRHWLQTKESSECDALPHIFDYRHWASAPHSMLNTPVTLAWFVALEVLRWIEVEGGLEAIAERNQRQADRLYCALDESEFYTTHVLPQSRSRMNIPFFIADRTLEPMFVAAAEQAGLMGLKGHRALGGLRASLYNSMEDQALEALVAFMKEFERRHG